MNAYLVDDERLALTRLRQLLEADGRVQIIGSNTDPAQALADLSRSLPDVVFLDIAMPGMSGFELLERLGSRQPRIVFTTAHDQYALAAFKVNSVDYLLKPIDPKQLASSIDKLERIIGGTEAPGNIAELLKQVRAVVERREPEYLVRVACRTGDRVEFIDVSDVSHFYARVKLTVAATNTKEYTLDVTIAELEQRLPPRQWIRIHRSTLLNVDAVKELRSWFGGSLLVKLKVGKTELKVTRERAADVKRKLGI